MINWRVWLGLALTVALSALALLGGTGLRWFAWIALIPLFAGWAFNRLHQASDKAETSQSASSNAATLPSTEKDSLTVTTNGTFIEELASLTTLRDVIIQMGTTLNRKQLFNYVLSVITESLSFDRAIIFVMDAEQSALVYGGIKGSKIPREDQLRLEQMVIPVANKQDFPLMDRWLKGKSTQIENASELHDSAFDWVFELLGLDTFLSVPLSIGDSLLGVVLVDNIYSKAAISDEARRMLEALAVNISIALENARLYQLTDQQLSKQVQKQDMLRQIDRELMEGLAWDRVLNMTLDWALRMTNAHSASLAVVNQATQELTIAAGYGFELPDNALQNTRLKFDQGIMGRVARTRRAALVGDVNEDPDYIAFSKSTRSYLSVPIRRRGRVIAVLNLESPHLNGFTQDHLDFTEQLANRASVALDNARLLEETQKEREKLSSIVEKIADIVIVVDFDLQIILLNEAAISAFRLNPRSDFSGRPLVDVFKLTPLASMSHRLLERDRRLPIVDEIVLDETRYFHTHIAPNEQVGWVIIMHDVTPFKETEHLKNELIATVSHDLKNPLSVINGYIELLGMYNELNDRGQEFMRMIRRSIHTMRQLIDDLLDLAHFDAGLELVTKPLRVGPLIEDSVLGLKNLADEKHLDIMIDVPTDLPQISADDKRLRQVLINLISNAIKYTPPEGKVHIRAKSKGQEVMISVEDSGIGISPEDQAQVFERFFRVRRPETDGIEGTGLGLAIVRSLVEAHGGEMGLKSHLGEGSTFFFTMPIANGTAERR